MPRELTVGSLFSGIGGFDLGLERTGHMRTVWFCEQDPYCQRVLAKHWPGVPCHPDVRALVADTTINGRRPGRTGRPDPDGARQLEPAHGGKVPVPVPYVDILCGGFPCQDLSYAGKGAGLDGERSGLWAEYARLVRELRPRYVVVENVGALLARGIDRVLGDLAACGYDAEWDCIPASAVGAPHRRDRVWLVAYPGGEQHEGAGAPQRGPVAEGLPQASAGAAPELRAVADPGGIGCERWPRVERDRRHEAVRAAAGRDAWNDGGASAEVADADGAGRGERRRPEPVRAQLAPAERGGEVGDADGMARAPAVAVHGERGTLARPPAIERTLGSGGGHGNQWLVEPDVGRVAHGIPARVDRLRSLGNALVPQIAEWLGERILAYEGLT